MGIKSKSLRKPSKKLYIEISKSSNVLKEMFGKAKFKKSTEEILKEARKNISKWM